jgi:hypothetical protein
MMFYISRLLYNLASPIRMFLYDPFSVLKGPKKLLNISLPTRVALLIWLFLVVLTITSYVTFLMNKERAGWETWWGGWERTLIIFVLIFAIPIIIRQTLKLWLEGEKSAYPDIDFAWKAGLDALKESGIDPTEVPIFVIVGNRDHKEASNLFEASGLQLRVSNVPDGPAALHWFATPDAVYLCCTETSYLSLVASGGASVGHAAPAAKGSPGKKADIRGTMMSGDSSDPVETPDIRGTAASIEMDSDEESAPAPRKNAAIYGTMVIGGDSGDSGVTTPTQPPAPSSSISIAAANEQKARLSYVGGLLQRLRQPVCPINGILSLLPFDQVAKSAALGQAVQRATKSDLTALFDKTQLRCSVIAVVTDMESESGFRELVRRVGPDRAMANRFGKGFDLWSPPIPEQIEAVSRHACGAFEDWTYKLFRERDGLKKHGNTKLYSLLCKIRCHMTERLGNILVDAYSNDGDSETSKNLLFSGVYFVAAGDTEDRRAFVKAVFDKLDQEESELDWTEKALADDERYQNLANLASLVSGVMMVSLVGMFVWWYAYLRDAG